MMTSEIPHLFGTDRISDDAVSPLADNVVLVSYHQVGNAITRTMAVIKTRASRHDSMIRTFTIGPEGIVLDDVGALDVMFGPGQAG